MKRTLLAILALLSLSSCRNLILEDRTPCPSFLFFDIRNAAQFEAGKEVYISALDAYSDAKYTADTTVLADVQVRDFYLKVPKADITRGFGVLGFQDMKIDKRTRLLIAEGNDSPPLYRFDYAASTRDESSLVPVEMVKDHAKVTVTFRNCASYRGADGRFPFYILIKGNTCGIDGLSGIPIAGPFSYRPPEEKEGVFHFIVPRQADHSLTMELWAREGMYKEQGCIRTFNLWSMFRATVRLTWEEKNLPDIELGIDFRESSCHITVRDWCEKYSFDLEF